MKRIGYLFEKMVSFENLYTAYLKARKGCRKNHETAAYDFFMEKNILDLRNALISGTYKPGRFRFFTVKDPKQRTIAVAPFADRVVHHAVVNIMEPIYEPCFIYDSYATRKGKGTHAAINRAQSFILKNKWFLKIDIKKYFDSIDHSILKDLLVRKIKDRRFLLPVFHIIDNGGTEAKGLPIGNLTSQFLANVYLNSFDHFIKNQLNEKYYLRYMDDFVLFSDDKEHLKHLKHTIRQYLQSHLQLQIKPEASFINSRMNGLSFLGARVFPSCLRIQKKSLKRCLNKLDQRISAYNNQSINETEYIASLNSIVAHLQFFCGRTMCNRIFQQLQAT